VGAFDGVHLGHQQMIRAAVNDAHAHRAQSVVVTFHPHPRIVLGRAPALYLTTPEEKAEQMRALGVDVLVIHAFDAATARMPAEEFVLRMVEGCRMFSLWVGPDFALGNQRRGDADFLRRLGGARGFRVNVLPPVNVGADRISSTRIRNALARGDLRDVNLCLGRPFRVIGRWLDRKWVELPPQHALPPPGRYPAWVCGALNEARLPGGERANIIELAAEVDPCPSVAIDFVDAA
jgi:riboflavin kinase/FMN adenylyltransferase